jgi:hypothetical protein
MIIEATEAYVMHALGLQVMHESGLPGPGVDQHSIGVHYHGHWNRAVDDAVEVLRPHKEKIIGVRVDGLANERNNRRSLMLTFWTLP